eukprot:633465-Ditylum_brightwellii.AAC.1
MWKEDAHQKLVLYPILCKIPMMIVNEGGSDKLQQFLKDCNNCLHNQVCMLAQNIQAASPLIGIQRRGTHQQLMMPNEGDQMETDKSEVT